MRLWAVTVARIEESTALVAAETREAAETLALADAKTDAWDFDLANFEIASAHLIAQPHALAIQAEPVVTALGEVAILSEWLKAQEPKP